MLNKFDKIQCPCCKNYTIDDDKTGIITDICPVCFWHYDTIAQAHPYECIGPNSGISLYEAQINYKKFGACKLEFKKFVRSPTKDELSK